MSPPRPEHSFSTFAEFYKLVVVLTKHAVVFLFKLSSSVSQLDYCNSALSRLSSSTLQPLSSVLHRLIKDFSPRNHITPKLKPLHWLPMHSCPNRIQNLHPHVSHPFWNLSIIHFIYGYAMLCFQVQRTPIILGRRFCCSWHKSEVWQL